MRLVARRSVVALRNIAPGETFDQANVGLRRVRAAGYRRITIGRIFGLFSTRDIKKGERLSLGDMRT